MSSNRRVENGNQVLPHPILRLLCPLFKDSHLKSFFYYAFKSRILLIYLHIYMFVKKLNKIILYDIVL